ncbi:MAG: TraR/DksA C4-type zinc finger protein [Actinomycetes bacterium]|jgi:DnaK suppressor protein|nr:MAG: TraR/DksA family transcriptional regulator [Actinomycetota bacterium]
MAGLSSVQIQALRQELEEQLQRRLSQMESLKASAEGGTAAEMSWQDVEVAMAATDRAIAETRRCLEMLDNGTYGRCEQCNAEIPFERLKIRPLARYCITCQRKQEAA